MLNYDAIIIGSGQGGNPLAHKLADRGWRVALVEREYLGGSCVNYGCTPTKTMIASARAAHRARRAGDYGVRTGEVEVDLAAVVARKDEMVRTWREGQQKQADERETLFLHHGHARFTGPHTIDVDGEQLTSERIFIDTGTRPRIPQLEGLDEIELLTNRTVMQLDAVPEHLIVLGGSYIGLEFAQMYHRFGSDVTVIEYADRLIPREEPEISEAIRDILQTEGLRFHCGAEASAAAPHPDGLRLTFTDSDGRERQIAGSHLLAAIGRVPNADDLGLGAAGVETDDKGFIQVNERLETSVEGVWAIGDVKGGPAFTHVSYDDHLVILENLDGGERTIEDRFLRYALYTDPELGRVGMTEAQARDEGYRLKTASLPMSHVARAKERGETDGMMKVVIDAETDRLLGAAILAVEGGELVQTLMTLMLADAPWTTLKRAMFIHPTLTEGFFSLLEQVEGAE